MGRYINIAMVSLVSLLLSGCLFSQANRQEMQETGQVPESVKNEAQAWMSIYCDAPILGNVNTVLTNLAQGIYPSWRSSCETWRAEQEQAEL